MSSTYITARWYNNTLPSDWLDDYSTESDVLSDEVTRYELSESQWDRFLSRDVVASKTRLHYYLLRDIEGRDFDTISSALFNWESGGFTRPNTQLSGTAIADSNLYLFYNNRISEEIVGVVVLRPHTNFVVIRVSEDEFADTVYKQLATMLGYDVDDPVRPAFDAEYHKIFEEDIVDRYRRLWIELGKEADQRVNKIQFISERGENARQSDRVSEILSLSGANIYGGQVEASGFGITQRRSFFFNWKHKRVTFQSRPNEATKLEISGALDRIRSITLTPPVDRILRIGEIPIRTEVYEGQYASTWRDRLELKDFADNCTQLDVPNNASVIVYLPEGEGTMMSFREFQEEPPESSIFVRVNGRESSYTWELLQEQSRDQTDVMLGVISGDDQPKRLADAFSQFTASDFTDAAATTMQDLLQTPSEEVEE